MRPEFESALCLSHNGFAETLTQAPCSDRAVAPPNNDLERLCTVWYKRQQDNYGEQCIIATFAAVKTAQDPTQAPTTFEWAQDCWASRR